METRYAPGGVTTISHAEAIQLYDYENGPFADREKAVLRFAEQMYRDHHQINETHWAGLHEHFTKEEIVEVSWAIGEFISLGRLVYIFNIPYEGAPEKAVFER